jgi:thioester reductase-like protein
LLAELLEVDGRTVIHCLVRGDGHRIEQNLRFYGLWREEWHARIVPVEGDLALPLLGLTADPFHHLAQTIDTIYHNGAWVNFIYPYAILKPANVASTQEILRLASQGKAKAVHYVSTLSVFPPSEAARMEADPLDEWQGLAGSYAQSKWVAERILRLAQVRGFAVSVYRPGRITGHGETAVFNHDDFLYKLIKGCLQLGLAPKLDMQVDMTPVNYVSRAIVQLSRQPQAVGQAYHLLNAHPILWRDLLGWLQNFGYQLDIIPYEAWRMALLSTTPDNALHPFLPIFSEDTFALDEDTRFDAQNALKSLAETPITCPPVDNDLLMTYFLYFIETGFLDRPPTSGKVQVVTFRK